MFRLKRNYYKNPLKPGELPDKDDFYLLMITLLLPKEDMARALNVLPFKIAQFGKKLGILRSKQQISVVREKTNLKRYGVKNKSQLPEFKEQYKKTCMEKYGVPHTNMLPEIKKKREHTNLERYGTKHASQSQQIKDKVKRQTLEKYGVESINMLPEKIEKCKQTCLKKYGKTTNLSTKEIKDIIKHNMQEKYGVDYPMQSKELLGLSKQTCLKKYGVENISQLQEIKDKKVETMHENNSFGHSKAEKEIISLFTQKFGKNGFKTEYWTDPRYPHRCDFYIPKWDLFIEYQGYEGHGTHPYTGSKEDLELIAMWKEREQRDFDMGKETSRYSSYPRVWTVEDVAKRNDAKKNNLNWIEFFNMDEFYNWFNTLY